MVRKLILRKDGILQTYNIKNLKRFNDIYEAISKVGNRLVWQRKEEEEKPKNIIYFINFELEDTVGKNTRIVGSLSSPFFISLIDGKIIIKNAMPSNWNLVNFYLAEDEGTQKEVLLIVFRGDDEIINQVINI